MSQNGGSNRNGKRQAYDWEHEQNGQSGSGNKKRMYDQDADANNRRRSGTGKQRPRPKSSGGYSRQASGRKTQSTGEIDNSIVFPTRRQNGQQPSTQRRVQNQNVQQRQRQQTGTGTKQRRNNGGNAVRSQNGQQRVRQQQAKRMRPVQDSRGAVVQGRRKKRRVTRAEMRRRRFAKRLTAFALLLCVIGVGVYITVTMLFKVNTIQVQLSDGSVVQEAGGYSSEQILQVLGVKTEENIFSFDASDRAAVLEKQFPLLEQIKVIKKYPNTVIVRVTEGNASWRLKTGSSWLILSDTLKILEKTSDEPDYPTLYGGDPVSTSPGDQLEFAVDTTASKASSADSAEDEEQTDKRIESLNTLITSLSEHGLLDDVTRIEFESVEQMAFLYQGRISVLLGTLNELDYKMDFAQYLLLNTDGKGCSETDTGTLDCSHVRTDGTIRPILSQGEPEMPSGWAAADDAAQKAETAESDETAESTEEESASDSNKEETDEQADIEAQAETAKNADDDTKNTDDTTQTEQ